MRRALAALGLCMVLATGGCATLPESSSPQAIGTIDRAPASSSVPEPEPGREPDLLLRDFLGASTDPSNRHLAARQFLTTTMSKNWDDAASATIVDKVDVLPESRSDNRATYTIRANRVGQLEPGGLYKAEEGAFETKISLTRVDGQWRIDELPPGVIMDRPQFLNAYQRQSLFFLDPSGERSVPDPRWISGTQDQMAIQLIGLLIDGPKPALAPAVRNELGNGISIIGSLTKADGRTAGVGVGLGGVRVDFHGVRQLDQQSRELFAAQVIWTLANADISGPYVLLADGQPMDERFPDGWTTADVASLNPLTTSSVTIGLHALRDGAMVSVTDSGVMPVQGYFGAAHNLRSVALSHDGGLVAAVADTGRQAPEPAFELMVGAYGDGAVKAVDGTAITRPTWALGDNTVWAAVNGTMVIGAVREPGTGRVSVVNVESGAIRALGGQITELRLSPDGARAALIVDGKVYVAIVVRSPNGEYALTAPRPIANGLGSPALSLDWSMGDTVVVARAAADIPVVQVAVDGSRMDALPSRNLTAPVVAVEASATTEFIADSRAVFQLNNNDPAGDRYWREVPGLTGVEAIPVLPG